MTEMQLCIMTKNIQDYKSELTILPIRFYNEVTVIVNNCTMIERSK